VGLEDEIQDHRARCQPHLLTLRMIARSEAAMVQPLQIVAEITEATGAILAAPPVSSPRSPAASRWSGCSCGFG